MSDEELNLWAVFRREMMGGLGGGAGGGGGEASDGNDIGIGNGSPPATDIRTDKLTSP
jgi:hypothetical protein